MNLKALITDDDAVSPVIGVILMVAITVILAAVIGTFVLGIGQNQQSAPSVTWDFDYSSSGAVTITHNGGDDINSGNTQSLRISSGGSSLFSCASGDFPVSTGDVLNSKCGSGGSVSPGGDEVTIIWNAPGGGRSTPIGSSTVP